MIADYSAEIKIVIFQSVLERRRDECRTSSNCGRIVAKIVHFNSENSEIVGRKFTIFVGWLLPLNLLKADLWSANPLSDAEEKSKVVPHDTDCATSYVLNSRVTETNLTKFLQGVQKWLPITLLKSKLRFSNPFRNANATNEDCRKIAGELWQKLHVLTA